MLAVDGGHGCPCDSYLIDTRRQSAEMQDCVVIIAGTVLYQEAKLLERWIERDWHVSGEPVAGQFHLQANVVKQDAKPCPQTIFRNHLNRPGFSFQIAAIGEQTEDGIVGNHGGRRAQGATETKINLAGVPPRPVSHLLVAKPGLTPGARLETTAGGAVVFFSWIPVPIVRIRGAGIQQGPKTQVRSVPEPQVRRGVFGKIYSVIFHGP